MNYRRLHRRAVVVLSAVLLTVGCGILPQNAEVPSDAALPTETAPASTVLPSVTPTADQVSSEVPATDVPPTAIPQAEASSYQVVLISPADLQVEIPEGWVSAGAGAVWVPVPGDTLRVGVSRADLAPPEEAEAILLPENAQLLDSGAVETPLGIGRQYTLEVYGATPQGDDAKADVASVEMHILVVVTTGDQRTGYDFYATAPTAETLDTVIPVLSHMVETAKLEIAAPLPEDDYDHIPAVASAKTRLAAHLSITEDSIRVVSAEAVDWSDACIGIHEPGQMCAQVITPGYTIMVDVDGQSYELHTNTSGSVVGIVP